VKIDSPTHQIQMTMLPCWMKQRRMGVWICWVGLAGHGPWGMHVARHLLLATLRGPAHSCYSVALSGPLFSSIYHAYSYILGLWIYSEGICMACEFTVKEWSRWIISCAKHLSVRVVAALQMPARIDRSIRAVCSLPQTPPNLPNFPSHQNIKYKKWFMHEVLNVGK